MKNKEDKKLELVPEDVELVVTQEDYETGLKRGWTRKAFPDDDSVNQALRVFAKAAKRQVSRPGKSAGQTRKQASRPRRTS